MINASFSSTGRDATISGAYQYDTGQRLKMHGLPSPSELAERDDFLSGDVVTVQAQYGFTGDSQTEASIAEWVENEEGNGYWLAKVPDVYMLKNQDVHVYVYVSYGQTETSMRSKTVYEAVFRPISRPAPQTGVTPDQTNAWDKLVGEINLKLTEVGTAISNANAQAETAKEAAERADQLSGEAVAWLEKLDATEVTAQTLPPGSTATVTVTDLGTHRKVDFWIPKGDPGIIRINNKLISDRGEVTLTAEDVGALPDTHQTVFEFEATLTARGWNEYESTSLTTQVVDVEGLLESDRPIVDIDSSRGISTAIIEAWSRVSDITVSDGVLVAYSLDGPIDTSIPIKILCVR